MSAKNGSNGATDPVGDSVEKVLKLYDLIKHADDVKREPVEIPEWGVTVWVRTLSGDDRDEFENWVAVRRQDAQDRGEEPNMRGIRARVAVMSVTDEDGALLFTNADLGWLGAKSNLALDRIFEVADRMSALTPGAQAALGKGSAPTAGADGPSPSPSASAKPGANSSATSTPRS